MTERKRRTSAERFVIIEVAKRMNDLHIDTDSQTGIAIEKRVNVFLLCHNEEVEDLYNNGKKKELRALMFEVSGLATVSSHNKIKALGLTGDISKDAALLEAAEKAAWK